MQAGCFMHFGPNPMIVRHLQHRKEVVTAGPGPMIAHRISPLPGAVNKTLVGAGATGVAPIPGGVGWQDWVGEGQNGGGIGNDFCCWILFSVSSCAAQHRGPHLCTSKIAWLVLILWDHGQLRIDPRW